MATPVGAEYVRFHQLARTLREQCPWDIEQTHHSLIPYLIEETYELVDALEALDPDDPATDEHLIEELGDLLYQIEFHATIAEQQGRFTIADVARGVHDKLVRRHPHVFGDTVVDGTETVLRNWDEIKRAEKGRGPTFEGQSEGVFDGIPGSFPALSYAHEVQKKAAKVGFDWPDVARRAGQDRRGGGRAGRGGGDVRPRGRTRRARRPAVRGRQRRPPSRRRPGVGAAGGDAEVPGPLRGRRGARTARDIDLATAGLDSARRVVGRGQAGR